MCEVDGGRHSFRVARRCPRGDVCDGDTAPCDVSGGTEVSICNSAEEEFRWQEDDVTSGRPSVVWD